MFFGFAIWGIHHHDTMTSLKVASLLTGKPSINGDFPWLF